MFSPTTINIIDIIIATPLKAIAPDTAPVKACWFPVKIAPCSFNSAFICSISAVSFSCNKTKSLVWWAIKSTNVKCSFSKAVIFFIVPASAFFVLSICFSISFSRFLISLFIAVNLTIDFCPFSFFNATKAVCRSISKTNCFCFTSTPFFFNLLSNNLFLNTLVLAFICANFAEDCCFKLFIVNFFALKSS